MKDIAETLQFLCACMCIHAHIDTHIYKKNKHEKSLVGYFRKLENDPFNDQKH